MGGQVDEEPLAAEGALERRGLERRGPADDEPVLAVVAARAPLHRDVEEDAASVLTQVFAEKNSSPLKLRFLKEGLAKSTFNSGFGGEDNGLAFVFEGANFKDLEKIKIIANRGEERSFHT